MHKVIYRVRPLYKGAYNPIQRIYNTLTPELEKIIKSKEAPCITRKGIELLGKVKIFKITREEIK